MQNACAVLSTDILGNDTFAVPCKDCMNLHFRATFTPLSLRSFYEHSSPSLGSAHGHEAHSHSPLSDYAQKPIVPAGQVPQNVSQHQLLPHLLDQ